MKKNNYFDNDDYRLKRAKKRKRKKVSKAILTVLGIIIIALAVFVITIKIASPDFDFSVFVPEQAVEYVKEDVLGQTTTTEPTTVTTTATTTLPDVMDYLPSEDFAFNTSVQGNFVGNLLNGGKVSTDMTYIYHIVDGEGIYRFYPSTEAYDLVYGTKDKLSCLNLRGDFLYYVNDTDNNLYKLQKGTSAPKQIAQNVRFVYVYDSSVYYVTTDNKLCIMDVKELSPLTLYNSADKELTFVGISLDRVFFTVEDEYNNVVQYRSVDIKAGDDSIRFRDDTPIGQIISPVMENGFLYYYATDDNGNVDLCRQKFGSQKVITIVKDVNVTRYATVDSNRLYYADIKDGSYRMHEVNMNSNNDRVLLSAKSDNNDSCVFQHGGEYDFIIGDDVYKASCIYTSSTNTMLFSKSKWKY
jgi:hypothetical protein